MSAQDLTNEEVLHHTEAFVTAGTAENRALAASATAAAYLPLLRAAREALSQPLGSGNPEVASLTQQLLDEDTLVHDPLAHAIHDALSAAAAVFPQPGFGSLCRNAREDLYPDGLRIVRKSYVEEAGAASARQVLRDSSVYAPAWAMGLGDTTVGALLDRWIASARRLGDLHRQRVTLTGSATDPTAADVLEARRQCLRLVDAMHTALRLEGAAPTAIKATFNTWDEAVRVATLRARTPEAPAPAPPAT